MKTFVFAIVVLTFSTAQWLTDFEQARHQAQEEHKFILLNFSGSDWCGPCIKMKRDLYDLPAFGEFASQKLVLVRADFPRNKKNQLPEAQRSHNEKLADKYNPNGKFPLTLLIDSDGRVVREWDGYNGQSVDEFTSQITASIDGR